MYSLSSQVSHHLDKAPVQFDKETLPNNVKNTRFDRGGLQFDKETLLSHVKNTRFDRGGLQGSGVVGLKPFYTGKLPATGSYEGLYSPQELQDLRKLQGTDRDVETRMSVKITDHYLQRALKSESLMNLVKARPEETMDLSGATDPSNQNKYAAVPGLLHKYEMVLLMVARTCSAHCRYCYRFDLFTNKSGKATVTSKDAASYVVEFNKRLLAEAQQRRQMHGCSSFPHDVPIREALLSGGDPMILSNRQLAEYMAELAQAGVETIRVGTKELAFFPYRFDPNFFHMLDLLHQAVPHLRLVFALHFTHPDEFLELAKKEELECRQYERLGSGALKWLEPIDWAVREFNKRRHFVSLHNQTPIIRKVNDRSDDLRLLQREMFVKGIENHYIFQCRDIQGKAQFSVPVEESWRIFTHSQRRLSGMQKHARFVMSTEAGKIEVVGLSDHDDTIIFRLHRFSFDTDGNNIIICKRNPNALWIDDYRDRVIYDPHGILLRSEESPL